MPRLVGTAASTYHERVEETAQQIEAEVHPISSPQSNLEEINEGLAVEIL